MLDAGKVWDSQKGWVAANPCCDRDTETLGWMHRGMRTIKNGWQVRTDHFFVTTNRSLAAGAELAARLERLYQIWRQLFAGFYYSEKEVKGLFAGERIARVQVRQFKVFYYRNRNDYVNNLSRRQPRIGETLGIYFDTNAEAHFFAEDVADDKVAASQPAGEVTSATVATLYHEAVHQLFQESKPAARRIGETANYWVIEGVATYFETLTEHQDAKAGLYYTIGEASAGRLPAAKEKTARQLLRSAGRSDEDWQKRNAASRRCCKAVQPVFGAGGVLAEWSRWPVSRAAGALSRRPFIRGTTTIKRWPRRLAVAIWSWMLRISGS